jgi:hypothetical protein
MKRAEGCPNAQGVIRRPPVNGQVQPLALPLSFMRNCYFIFLEKKNIITSSYSQFSRSDDAVILHIDCLCLSYTTRQRALETLLSNQS